MLCLSTRCFCQLERVGVSGGQALEGIWAKLVFDYQIPVTHRFICFKASQQMNTSRAHYLHIKRVTSVAKVEII